MRGVAGCHVALGLSCFAWLSSDAVVMQTYARDTIKEVLGWYGLQESSSAARDDQDHRLTIRTETLSPLTPGPVTPSALDLSNNNSPSSQSPDQVHSSTSNSSSTSSWSGHRKLIGMRFLFTPLSDDLSLLEKARIWVARHEHKYFVGWSDDDLQRVDPLLRPLNVITPELYKLHMNRSEYCRNVKLKYCLESESGWAKEFQHKLSQAPSHGGFTGLCQAKIAAAELWRKYSENYRSHQARYPNPKSKSRSKETTKRSPEEADKEQEGKKTRVMEPQDLSNGSSDCTSCDQPENLSKETVANVNNLNMSELSLHTIPACPSPMFYGVPPALFPFAQSPYLPNMDSKRGIPKPMERNSEYKKSERGLSYLFPSLSDHKLSLLDKVQITVLRHKNNYFLGWSEEELAKVDTLVRPKMKVTQEIYKEYCHRNAMKYDSNLQFAMESEEDWAVEFRSKLLRPPTEGGFSSLCEVKLEAGRLWREFSGKYRMHNIVKWQMDLNSAKDESSPTVDVKPDLASVGGGLHRSASLGQLAPSPSNHVVRGHKRSRSSVCSSPATSSLISPSGSEASKAHSTPPMSPLAKDSLFMPLPRQMPVAEQLFIWLERHKNSYFLGYSQEEIQRLNELVRPCMPVTEDVFKLYIPDSMVDVLSKIDQIMQRDEAWARSYQDRVHKVAGFSSFEEALSDAISLWGANVGNSAVKHKEIIYNEWLRHQYKMEIASPPSPAKTVDLWPLRHQLQMMCREDPAHSLHSKLQPFLPLLRQKLGADYVPPPTSNDCLVDLVLSVLQSHLN